MTILIADDDPVSRCFLELTLSKWGYEVVSTCDGYQALSVLERDAPAMAILDWMMPGIDGTDVCRKIRAKNDATPSYIILLTAKGANDDIIEGFDAGADDYVIKPFNRRELHARIKVGLRVTELQRTLAERVFELEGALSRVRQLQGLLPICSYCKKVRDDKNYWQQVDSYITKHTDVEFSHSICPACYEAVLQQINSGS